MIREVINTYEQLVAAGTGVAICWYSANPRACKSAKWSIMRIKDGKTIKTNPNSAWYDYGQMCFSCSGDRMDRLVEAKKWVLEKYGETGPWKRNRMGDYVPEQINKDYPVRK